MVELPIGVVLFASDRAALLQACPERADQVRRHIGAADVDRPVWLFEARAKYFERDGVDEQDITRCAIGTWPFGAVTPAWWCDAFIAAFSS